MIYINHWPQIPGIRWAFWLRLVSCIVILYRILHFAISWTLLYREVSKLCIERVFTINAQFTVKLKWPGHGWLVHRGWFELVFESLGNSSDRSRKRFRDSIGNFSYFIIEMYIRHTIILFKIEKTTLNYPNGDRNTRWLVLLMSRTNFLSSKDLRAIEVRLYWQIVPWLRLAQLIG